VVQVAGRVLRVADHAFGRILDRGVEDLAARHVRSGAGNLGRACLEAEREVGAVADDSHLLGAVEARRDLLHLPLERRPVDLLQVNHPEPVCQRLRRVAVGEPADDLVDEQDPNQITIWRKRSFQPRGR